MGSISACPHFVIFPFMSQGHTIPLLSLSRLLRHNNASVTIFTTARNSQLIRDSLQDTDVSIMNLPFPQNIEGVPQGVENTHELPSMSSFYHFVTSTKLMQKDFEQALQSLDPPVSCIISDMFLGWTFQSAQKIGVPRLGFSGMGNFSSTIYSILGREKPHVNTKTVDENFVIPDFPKLKLTRNDFDPPFGDVEPSGPYVDFVREQMIFMAMSYGVLVNSFYDLEAIYVDYWNHKFSPKAFCIGPLCMAAPPPPSPQEKKSRHIEWLNEKLGKEEAVVYVAFGTQAEVTEEQLEQICKGLEQSNVNFLWVLKSERTEYLKEFENRVKNRAMIITNGWVDQLEILSHESIKGFLSHCGWNSVMESISMGVPILAMPLIAEQHMNARFVVEVAGIGIRIMPVNGSVRGFVSAEKVEEKVRELMGGGEKAEEVRRKAAEYGVAACNAMKEGGSSLRTLDLLIHDVYSSSQLKGEVLKSDGIKGQDLVLEDI